MLTKELMKTQMPYLRGKKKKKKEKKTQMPDGKASM